MTSSFDKNNLGKESFALGKEIHRNKRKRGYQDYRRKHIKKRALKIYSMHASKPTPVLLSRVIGLEFSGFQEPLYDRSKEKVACVSAVGSIISAQKNLPWHSASIRDILAEVQSSNSSLEWSYRIFLQFCKVMSASC